MRTVAGNVNSDDTVNNDYNVGNAYKCEQWVHCEQLCAVFTMNAVLAVCTSVHTVCTAITWVEMS